MRHIEASEQIAVMDWALLQSRVKGWELLKLLYHVPNGGSRNKIEAADITLLEMCKDYIQERGTRQFLSRL